MESAPATSELLADGSSPREKVPFISVVMCTYNRPDMLRNALASLADQETDGKFQYEIVVVLNGNVPPTLAVIDEIAAGTSVEIRAIHESRRGQVVARNRALAEARGEWLAHFDDDQLASPRWLVELLNTATERNVRVVGGSLYLKFPDGCERDLSPVCRRMLGQSVEWDTVRPYTRKEGPGSGNIMIHRSVIDKVGNYDESFQLRGYDTDMYRRIREAGFEAWFTPLALGYHVTPSSRLADEYFRETCLHNGWSFARRDRLELGNVKVIGLMCARIVHASILHVPRWLIALCSGSDAKILTARCRIWRTQGYVRSVLYGIFPSLFPQRKFFSKYEFRAEKKLPSAGHGAASGT